MPPGEVITYNNATVALAGYLVEIVSGLDFEQFVRENIFKPLNMQWSSFELPYHMEAHLAKGYTIIGRKGSTR